jgi:hypothetical protein
MGGIDTDESYIAAVTRYAREKCGAGQLLKLVSPGGLGDRTDKLNQQIALALCEPQTIDREPIGMAREQALIVHCLLRESESVK